MSEIPEELKRITLGSRSWVADKSWGYTEQDNWELDREYSTNWVKEYQS